MNLHKHIILIIWVVLLPAISAGQNVLYEQFTTSDGLPSMTTYEMVQDSNGILWIGTEDGLVSYDGVEFTTYPHPDLKDNDIIAISLSAEGYIYFFNLSNQLGRVIDGKVEIVLESDANICDIISTRENEFILCRYLDFSYLTDKSFVSKQEKVFILVNDTLSLYSNLKEDTYNKWYYTQNLSYANGNNPINRIFYIQNKDSLHFLYHEDKKIREDHLLKPFKFSKDLYNPKLLFHVGKFKNKNVGFTLVNQSFFLSQLVLDEYNFNQIKQIVTFGNDHFIILNDRLEYYNAQSGQKRTLLNKKSINTVFIDREKNLWASSTDHGVFRIPFPFLKIIQHPNKDDRISTLIATEDMLLCAWTDHLQLRDKSYELLLEFDLKTSQKCVATVDAQKIYVSTKENLLIINQSNEFVHDTAFVLSSKSVAVRNNVIYTSSIDHIFCFDLDNFPKDPFKDKIYAFKTINLRNVKSLMYSQNQDLLLAGTPEGLFEIKKDFSVSKYAPELDDAHIIAIEEDLDSCIWVACKNKGIFKTKKGEVLAIYNIENGLLSNKIKDIAVFKDKLYASSSLGISQIDGFNGKIINKDPTNGLYFNNIDKLCVFNESMWISSHKDLMILDESFFAHHNIAPVLSISKVHVNNQEIELNSDFKLKSNENKIDIYFNNISFSSKNNNRLKYKITKNDLNWTISSEPVIRLNSLKPGNYLIEAKGLNKLGIESNSIEIPVTINPPWWDTLWSKLLAVLGLVIIGYIVILYRSRRIRKQEAVKRDYLNQINAVKDKALQLQMNPHFIFNSLNAIQGFIGTENEEKALNYLARFARLIRLIFEYSKGDSITLEKELEFVQLYLDLEKLRFKEKIDIQLHIDPEIDTIKDMVHISPLLVQPIIENSFKHGLFHKKDKGTLTIKYKLQEETLCIIVQDNGIGRTNAAKIAENNHEKHISTGINTTKERLDLLNFKSNKNKNTIHIEDLYENEKPAGTRTILHLSLKFIKKI